jgi:hypothetical protein
MLQTKPLRKRIEYLADQQRATLVEWLRAWDIRVATEPGGRASLAAIVHRLYASIGRRPPAAVVWCGSALSLALTRSIVQYRKISRDIGLTVRARVRDGVGPPVGLRASNKIARSVTQSVEDSLSVQPGRCISHEFQQAWGRFNVEIGPSLWRDVLDICDHLARWRQAWPAIRSGMYACFHSAPRRHGYLPGIEGCADSLFDQQELVRVATEWRLAELLRLARAQTEQLALLRALKDSGTWILPHENLCWVARAPSLHSSDDRGRLHATDGPALALADSWSIHAVHGVSVPDDVVEHPELISVAAIDAEPNAEVRRVMIDRYRLGEEISGAAAFLRDAGGLQIDHDKSFGRLWRRDLKGDEPLVMIEVINATRETDGCFRRYFLGVPPAMTKARDAMASTFGLGPEAYAPRIET